VTGVVQIPVGRASVPAQLLGADTRAIVVAASRDPNAKITTLLLRAGADHPTLALKVPTSSAAARAVRVEAAVLRALPRVLPLDLLLTVPRVVRPIDPVTGAMVTTAVAGTPMQVAYHRWRHVSRPASVTRDFAAAGAWLARLHEATAAGRAPVAFAGLLAPRLEQRFADDRYLDAASTALAGAHARLATRCAPRTVVHGDFWHGNLLTRRGAVVGVIDWEAGALSGDPLRDIARFAIAYALYLDRHTPPGATVRRHPAVRAGEWGGGVRSVLTGQGWFARLVQEFVGDRIDRLGIGGDMWRDVLIGGLAEAAVAADEPDFAHRHLALLASCAPSGAPGRRSA
jgi:hypothetical protein